ncbi:hypothetical protein [Micromonospora lupini]|uniref:hypothetical protein n=1 Tax=Micromonospora lupini TaxID=285679 RepID=UPI00225554FE|nr:hypothetical protein [Micromonospora lupini]
MADIAEIGARVQGVASMQPKTISQHLFESGSAIPVKTGGTRRGKYASDPFPAPSAYAGKGKKPWWALEREQDIVAWFERHPRRQPGDGIGGVRPKAERSERPEQAPVRRVTPGVTVRQTKGVAEVHVGDQVRTFEAPILRRAVELRREHPRSVDAVAEGLVAGFEMSKSRAREYASAARTLVDAGVDL